MRNFTILLRTWQKCAPELYMDLGDWMWILLQRKCRLKLFLSYGPCSRKRNKIFKKYKILIFPIFGKTLVETLSRNARSMHEFLEVNLMCTYRVSMSFENFPPIWSRVNEKKKTQKKKMVWRYSWYMPFHNIGCYFTYQFLTDGRTADGRRTADPRVMTVTLLRSNTKQR